MANARNTRMARLLLLCLLLGAAGSTFAVTRDVRMHGPNGNGGGSCPDATPAAPKTAPANAPATTGHHDDKLKPAIGVRGGGDDAGSHAPRWHSFLPGMFR